MAQVNRQFEPTDTCARCGLRRATRDLEAKGVFIRLCDDCFWGKEPATEEAQKSASTPGGYPQSPQALT